MKVGDIVTLRSGGPNMTVESVTQHKGHEVYGDRLMIGAICWLDHVQRSERLYLDAPCFSPVELGRGAS